MAFVVAAHLRSQAGNVIAPPCQNLANDWINALLTHGGSTNKSNQAEIKICSITATAPKPQSARPAAPGSGTNRRAWPAPFRPLSARFPGDCSAQTDAPARQ